MKRTAFVTSAIICCSVAFAQDVQFQNPNHSLVNLNPSFAGSNGGIRNQASYRNAMPNLSAGSTHFRNTFDLAALQINGGFALSYFFDEYANGIQRDVGYALSYAQYLRLSEKWVIVPSLQVQLVQKRLDVTQLTFGSYGGFVWSQGSPALPATRKNLVSFSTGFVSMIGDHLTVGAYCFHLNQPDVGMLGASALRARTVVHASYTFLKSEKHMLQAFGRGSWQGNYSYVQGALNAVLFRHAIVGAGYGNNENVYLNAGYHHRRSNVVLGYDVTFSRLARSSFGSWELQASFNFAKLKEEKMVPFERF